MCRCLMTALLVLLVVLSASGAAWAVEESDEHAAGLDVADVIKETTFWAKWACILAGLALVGVIWVGWSMRTLATNQVRLSLMIQEQTKRGS
ncbi:hypothetical protein LCGC14_1431980 [marine sediment metagenome]|uniref:Uncharacterized protein n=1 Tax=marine sediment metagenome TaxID=412755 RepID=A0A0F9K9J0_9ZZZZ